MWAEAEKPGWPGESGVICDAVGLPYDVKITLHIVHRLPSVADYLAYFDWLKQAFGNEQQPMSVGQNAL